MANMSRSPLPYIGSYTFALLLAALKLSVVAQAVQPYEPNIADPLLEDWRWQHIKHLDGLSMQCMTQDANGVLWFGLRNGVLRYDGQQWRHFRRSRVLPQQVHSILAATDGCIYALTSSGISQFVDDQWKLLLRYDYAANVTPSQTLAEDSSGTVWAATRKGLVRIHTQAAELYEPVAGGVTRLLIDSADNLWWLDADCGELRVMPLRQGQFESAAQERRYPSMRRTSNGRCA